MSMKTLTYRLSSILIGTVLTLGLFFTSGCVGGGNPTTTTPPSGTVTPATTPPATTPATGTRLKNYNEVFEKVKPSVVAVESRTGTGTGWVYESTGIIITNNHVIADSLDAAGAMIFAPRVTFTDGMIFTATRISTDPRTDLAVVFIGTNLNLPALIRGDSAALQVGEPVAAIGHPLGEPLGLKGGWVSTLNAEIVFEFGDGLYGLIETDATINPGNSGGPLVNMAGEIIGITSAKLVDVQVEGVGYAISMKSAQAIINELIANGKVTRPRLGVTGSNQIPAPLITVNVAIANLYGLKINQGVMVTDITPGGPFEKAGGRARDVITHFEGVKVNNVDELQIQLYQKRPGDTVNMTLNRAGTTVNVTLTLDLLTEP
jgi:serine protease Do